MASNLINRTPGYLLTRGTGMSISMAIGEWRAAARYAQDQHGGFASTADRGKQLRPTTVEVPTGTPPSARWRRP